MCFKVKPMSGRRSATSVAMSAQDAENAWFELASTKEMMVWFWPDVVQLCFLFSSGSEGGTRATELKVIIVLNNKEAPIHDTSFHVLVRHCGAHQLFHGQTTMWKNIKS